MHNDSRTPARNQRAARPGESRTLMLAIASIVLGVFVICIVMAWVTGRGLGTADRWIRVWPQAGHSATELVRRLRHVDGVRDVVAVYRGTLPSDDFSDTGWATVYYLANRTDTASLAYLPPDPALTLWKGHQPDPSSTDETLVAYELAESLDIKVGQTLTLRGFPFLVVGIWGQSTRAPGNWLQISSAAADLIEPSAADSASYVTVLPAARSEAQQVAARIRDRWMDLEVSSPDWEEVSSVRERILMVAVTITAVVIGLLLSVSAIGANGAVAGMSSWVVAVAGASGAALCWVASSFANWYARVALGVTPFIVGLATIGYALVAALLIHLLAQLPAVKRVSFHFVSAATLFCLCAAMVVVAGAARESLALTLSTARRVATDWVSLGNTAPTEGLLQEIYRLPGIRALTLEAYGGPVREEDTRWRGGVPVAGVLYGVESATGIGSWTLPLAGGFAEGADLALGTDQAVLGYELAKEQGLGLGDTLLARGVPLQVVGIRRSGLAFPGSDAGRRVYVTFDTLERVLDTRDLQKRITLLVPSAESQEIKELFLREVAARLRVGQVETIDDRLGEIVLDYPGVWTITAGSSTEKIRHAQTLYNGLLALVVLVGLAVVSLSLRATWARSVSEEQERLGVLKALGSTEGQLLGEYLQRILTLGSAAGLAGVVVGQVACYLLNQVGHEGAFRLVVTPGLATAAFVGSVLAALASSAAPVAAAVRRDATAALYTAATQETRVPLSGMEAMHGGSES